MRKFSPKKLRFVSFYSWIWGNLFLISFLLIAFLLRLPFLFEPFVASNETLYATFAKGLTVFQPELGFLDFGVVKFIQLSFLLFGFSIWSVKFATTLWLLANLAIFVFLAKKILGQSKIRLLLLIILLTVCLPFWGANQLSPVLLYLPAFLNLVLFMATVWPKLKNLLAQNMLFLAIGFSAIFIFGSLVQTQTSLRLNYYQNFAVYTFNKTLQNPRADENYLAFFGKSTLQGHVLSGLVVRKTTSTESVFQFGNIKNLYLLSERRSASTFLTIPTILRAQEETLSQLSEAKPKLILISIRERTFAQLDRFLKRSYNRSAETEDVIIYVRKN